MEPIGSGVGVVVRAWGWRWWLYQTSLEEESGRSRLSEVVTSPGCVLRFHAAVECLYLK